MIIHSNHRPTQQPPGATQSLDWLIRPAPSQLDPLANESARNLTWPTYVSLYAPNHYGTRGNAISMHYMHSPGRLLGEIGMLLFGIYLIYKLRNASTDAHKEKLVLSASVFIELLISTLAYIIRHTFWQQLSSDQLLVLYCARCQLTVTLTVALVFGPKVSRPRRLACC